MEKSCPSNLNLSFYCGNPSMKNVILPGSSCPPKPCQRRAWRVTFLKSSVVLGFALFLLPSLTLAQHYTQTNLVSNTGNAPLNDSNLQNAWGAGFQSDGQPLVGFKQCWWYFHAVFDRCDRRSPHRSYQSRPQRVCKNPQLSQPDSSRFSHWSDV